MNAQRPVGGGRWRSGQALTSAIILQFSCQLPSVTMVFTTIKKSVLLLLGLASDLLGVFLGNVMALGSRKPHRL